MARSRACIKPINLEDLLWTIECALACRVGKHRKTFGDALM